MKKIAKLLLCHAAATLLALQLSELPAYASPATGACCFSNLTCQDITELACTDTGGSFIGADTSCATIQCRNAAAPVISILGLVGVMGALGGLGTYRIVRRRMNKTA